MNDLQWRILCAINFIAFLAALLVSYVLGGCSTQLDLASGGTMPMKCHWTFYAVILTSLIGIALIVCATYVNERMARLCCMIGVLVTIVVICLIMTSIGIGVCGKSGMHCHTTRAIVFGCMAVSAVVTIISFVKVKKENTEGLDVPKQSV